MRDSVLRYLGHDNQHIDHDLNTRLDRYIEFIRSVQPKIVIQEFDITHNESIIFEGTTLSMKGESLKSHLEGCDQVLLFAVTLGVAVDKALQKLSYGSSLDLLILDACASAYIEDYLDAYFAEYSVDSKYLTNRFSPGYGDLSLNYQKDILAILQAHKKIGISANQAFVLTPKKSVTGLIGISKHEVEKKYDICDACLLRITCDRKICKKG